MFFMEGSRMCIDHKVGILSVVLNFKSYFVKQPNVYLNAIIVFLTIKS